MAVEGWRSIGSPLVELQVPASWLEVQREERLGVDGIPVPDADTDAVAAMPGVPAGRFRPNVVVTGAQTDEPIEVLSSRVIAETGAIAGWSRSLACDVWPDAGAPARRHEFFYVVGLTVVLVTTHLLRVHRHRVDVTFSRGLEDAVPLRDVGAGIAAGRRGTPATDGAILLDPLPSAALVQQLLALAPLGGLR